MRSLVATPFLALALVLALAQGAQAQQPTMTVTITGLPTDLSGFSSNNTTEAAFTVDVRVQGVVCAQGGSVAVTISVEAPGAPPFVTVTADPTEGAVAIAQGQYVAAAASGNVPSKVKMEMKEITANATLPVTVKASAAAPTGCQGAGTIAPQEASATFNATITAPPPPPAPPAEPAESPGPGALMGILAAALVAAFRRRAH